MQDFNNQFKQKGSAIIKTAEVLGENKFWKIIEKSLKFAEDREDHEECLLITLEKLKPSEILGFRLQIDKLLYETYTPEMWCAAYIMNGGCSDDGFEYFRCWLISRGRETYQKAKQNPDYLIQEVADDDSDEYEFEHLWYIAFDAFENKTGKEAYDYIDYDNVKTQEKYYPTIEINWREEEPETMKKICPQLMEKLWDNS